MTPMTAEASCAQTGADYLARAALRCKDQGVQLTPIRRDVLALLLEHDNGLKAYDLLARIKTLRSNATPPTVYRALDFLIEQGLVHKIERLNQFVACRHENHQLPGLFLVCTGCGSVSELHDHRLMETIQQHLAQTGHRFDCQEIELATRCPDCQRKAAV